LSFKLRKPNPKGEEEIKISLHSVQGYLPDSPDKDNDINIIHSKKITMIGVPHDVIGTDDLGNTKKMKPGKNYKFPGNKVIERKV
tara:strand:- start:599 stop:853 length:255 start_codon:yes stop_codon:yes gene_type:complete